MELEDRHKNISDTNSKQCKIVISKNKAIILENDQEKVLSEQVLAIIRGIAGSGKISVALEMIRKIVADLKKKREERIKAADISLSTNLVQEPEKAYWNIER